MRRWIPLTLGLALAPAAAPPSAEAQTPAQSEIDRAVALGHEGRAAYEAGRFAEALEHFRAADRIAHSPVLVLYVARCERNLGRLVAAKAAYRRAAEEALAPGAPAPFVTAKEEATRELAALDARIPRVRLQLAKGQDVAAVSLDGVALSAQDLEGPIEVDPGEHRVVVTAPSQPPEERTFRAIEGDPVVTLQIGGAKAPAPAAPSRPPPASSGGGGTIVPGLVVLGVGVAGLGVGAVTGLVASSKTSDIESRCDGTSCLASDAPLADEARTFATVSTIGFLVGGVAVASGVVLLVALSGDDDDVAARGPASPPASRPTLRVSASPGGVAGAIRF